MVLPLNPQIRLGLQSCPSSYNSGTRGSQYKLHFVLEQCSVGSQPHNSLNYRTLQRTTPQCSCTFHSPSRNPRLLFAIHTEMAKGFSTFLDPNNQDPAHRLPPTGDASDARNAVAAASIRFSPRSMQTPILQSQLLPPKSSHSLSATQRQLSLVLKQSLPVTSSSMPSLTSS